MSLAMKMTDRKRGDSGLKCRERAIMNRGEMSWTYSNSKRILSRMSEEDVS